ncbi:MAG: hypothetical protein IK070_02300 [Clostridia bacterium]|nr:hypothetical protein [Clostridia bacterium]
MTKSNKKFSIFYSNSLIFIAICTIIALYLLNPSDYISAGVNGLNVWAYKLVPTLLPFMIFTKLLISTGIPDAFGNKISRYTSTIYGAPGCGSYVYILSVLSGYPMNAKLICDLYNYNKINTKEAKQIFSFTSTSGPVFIIATVGIAIFNNFKLGVLVLICHMLGALLNGLLYRKKLQKTTDLLVKTNNYDIQSIVSDSINSMIIICVYIIIFFILITMLNNTNFYNLIISFLSNTFGVNANIITAILNGFVEITRGCIDLNLCTINFDIKVIVLTAIISFGGLSTIMQSYSFVKHTGVKFTNILIMKFTQCIISTLIAIVIILIL